MVKGFLNIESRFWLRLFMKIVYLETLNKNQIGLGPLCWFLRIEIIQFNYGQVRIDKRYFFTHIWQWEANISFVYLSVHKKSTVLAR